MRQIQEGIEDDTEAALINLDQSKSFDRVDHRFLAPEFRKWISMLYRSPQAVVQVNRGCSEVFAIERSVRQGCPLSPLLYVLALEPLLRSLRDERDGPALRGILLSGSVRAKISAFADDITVFVSRRRDILAVKEAVASYEKVAGAKVNFDKSEGLWLGAWRGSVPLPGPFRWSDGPVRILGVWFGPGLQLERNWLEVRTKVEAQVAAWLRRRLTLKGRAEVCAEYIFPLILYRFSVLHLPKDHRVALERSLFKLLWKGRSLMVRRQVCYQRPRDRGLEIPDLERQKLAERVAYLGRSLTMDAAWSLKVRVAFPRLRLNPKAEGRRRPRGARSWLLAFCEAPEPVLDFGPERGSAKGTMADLGPLIRHLVSTRLPSGGQAALLSPLSPMYGNIDQASSLSRKLAYVPGLTFGFVKLLASSGSHCTK